MVAGLDNTFSASFLYNSEAKPPLRLQIRAIADRPVVDVGMTGTNPAAYTSPRVSTPGSVQGTEGDDLTRVSKALLAVLKNQGNTTFNIQPAEDVSGVTVDLNTGREQSELPASWEVVRFIALTTAQLAEAAKLEAAK